MAKKKSTNLSVPSKNTKKRTLIDTGNSKRYVRRDEEGRFKEVDEQKCSLSQDSRKKGARSVMSGQGDRGDRQKA